MYKRYIIGCIRALAVFLFILISIGALSGEFIHKNEEYLKGLTMALVNYINTLPEGGLINSENLLILLIGILVIIVSALVVYNVFYLAIVSQIKELDNIIDNKDHGNISFCGLLLF